MQGLTGAAEATAFLPSFARYLLEKKLEEYIREQIRVGFALDLPLLKQFRSYTEEDLMKISLPTATEFLEYLSHGEAQGYINISIQRWISDQLPLLIKKNDLTADDIILVGQMRKRTFLKFVPEYTPDPQQMIALISEIDDFVLNSDRVAANTFIGLLKDDLDREHHFNRKITETTPGIILISEVYKNEVIYSNKKLQELLGYSLEEVRAMGQNVRDQLIHPEDLETVREHARSFTDTIGDGDVRTVDYRVRNKKGEYLWLRAYESVFKRSASGKVEQKITVSFRVDKEKRIEDQLLQREAQLLEAQELAGMGSFDWFFGDMQRTQMTPQLLRIFEMEGAGKLEEFIKDIHPGDQQRVMASIQKALQGTGNYEADYRYIKGGKEKFLSSRGKVSYAGGKPVSMHGTVIDLTEKERLINNLRKSDELYKQAQALSHIGNWSWELAENKMTWSDEMYRIFGLEPQCMEMTYDLIRRYTHQDDIAHVDSHVNASIGNRTVNDFYYRIVLDQGKFKTVHAKGNVLIDQNGKVTVMYGTLQDVTEQKETERKLLENQNFIQKIAHAAPSIIASYNLNTGQYIYVNQAIEKLLGYPQGDALSGGISFFTAIIHPDDLERIMKENKQAAAKYSSTPADGIEPIVEFKYRMRHRNGDYRWFHTYGTVFDRRADGHIDHVLNISVDITEIIEAEKGLSEKNDELRQSNANLEEFAYIASHDLKEPLRKISILGDKLLQAEKNVLSENGKAYLDKMIDGSLRMQSMINDLLSLSTITGNKSFEQYELKQVLKEVKEILDYKIETKKAQIKSSQLPEALINVSQFRQLFQNLISNSLKFSRTDVPPVISISHKILAPKDVRDLSLIKASKYLQLQFSDNGIGFENEYATRIFSIFQRLHGKSAYEGTGIGLAICKKIVENHNGVIYASGKPNEGSVFTIIIPLK